MPEWISRYWVQWLFGLVGAAICGLAAFMWNKFTETRTETRTEEKAIKRGLNSLIYTNLKSAAHEYCSKGWISIHDMEDVEDLYNTYHALGGNGTGTKIFNDIRALPNREQNKEG